MGKDMDEPGSSAEKGGSNCVPTSKYRFHTKPDVATSRRKAGTQYGKHKKYTEYARTHNI